MWAERDISEKCASADRRAASAVRFFAVAAAVARFPTPAAMRIWRANSMREPALIIATWNVNSVRQRLPHLLDYLGEVQPRRDLPAGDQMRRRGVSARRDRGARLQCRDARAEDVQRRRDPRQAAVRSRAGPPGDPDDEQARYIEGVIPTDTTASCGSPASICRTAIRRARRNMPTSSPSWIG